MNTECRIDVKGLFAVPKPKQPEVSHWNCKHGNEHSLPAGLCVVKAANSQLTCAQNIPPFGCFIGKCHTCGARKIARRAFVNLN